ncbi:MAG: hypothetical protein FWG90_10450 [Oscillospiraceae bacterium]|nr:hypothetical protein [Oscillospiraceae bacterium]
MTEVMEKNGSAIFSFIEAGGHLTTIQKQLCIDLLHGDISTDEYLCLFFKESMDIMRKEA